MVPGIIKVKTNEIGEYEDQTVAVFGAIFDIKEYCSRFNGKNICGCLGDEQGSCEFTAEHKVAEEFQKIMGRQDIYALLIGEIKRIHKKHKLMVRRISWV